MSKKPSIQPNTRVAGVKMVQLSCLFATNCRTKCNFSRAGERAFLASFILICTPQNISLFAISSITSLLWSIARKQHVADTPLTKQSAENLTSRLNSVLKAAAMTTLEDSKSSFNNKYCNVHLGCVEKSTPNRHFETYFHMQV